MYETVSVILPVRNGTATIGACLDSILRQDYPLDRIRLMIVDGNSMDGTAELAQELLSSRPEAARLQSWAILKNSLDHGAQCHGHRHCRTPERHHHAL